MGNKDKTRIERTSVSKYGFLFYISCCFSYIFVFSFFLSANKRYKKTDL